MARIILPSDADMSATQRAVRDEVLSGKRGLIPAPLIAWIANPELARRALSLGELLRFETTLSRDLSELVIILCARHWTSHAQWVAHKKYALQFGISEQTVADIAAGRVPELLDPAHRTAYDVTVALLEKKQLSDELYQRAVEVFGVRGLSELVVLLGYYCLASLTLNTFELGLPEKYAPELDAAGASGSNREIDA
jgi:4-carboxymuconolactone decarboxylase